MILSPVVIKGAPVLTTHHFTHFSWMSNMLKTRHIHFLFFGKILIGRFFFLKPKTTSLLLRQKLKRIWTLGCDRDWYALRQPGDNHNSSVWEILVSPEIASSCRFTDGNWFTTSTNKTNLKATALKVTSVAVLFLKDRAYQRKWHSWTTQYFKRILTGYCLTRLVHFGPKWD